MGIFQDQWNTIYWCALALNNEMFLALFNRSWIKCEYYSQSQNNNCVQYFSWHKHHEKTHVWKEDESFL